MADYQHPPLSSDTICFDANGKATPEFVKMWQELGVALKNTNTIAKNAATKAQSTVYNIFSGFDGDHINFGGIFTSTPSNVTFDLSALPSLAVGESYIVKVVNMDKDGCDLVAKKAVLGSPVTQNTGAGSYDGTYGGYTAQKPVSADAYNQAYTFDTDVELSLIGGSGGSGYDSWIAEYQATLQVDVYIGAVWQFANIIELSTSQLVTGTVPSTYLMTGVLSEVLIYQAIGLAAGASVEFGIKALVGSISALNDVSYETKTTGSETALTEKITGKFFY